MNKIVTSREAILEVSQRLASTKGLQAINIRTVAMECNVSIGSIYNYFPSKADLMLATIEEIWKSFFHMRDDCYQFQSFIECIDWIYQTIQKGAVKYPGFFLAHAQGLDSESLHVGREVMDKYFIHIQEGMLFVLHQDKQIRKNVFDQKFKEKDFIDFIFSNMISLLSQNQVSCSLLKEVIQRILY